MHILLQLGWFSGWVLGIIGFFSALSAHAELRRLRVTLGQHPIIAEPAETSELAPSAEYQPPKPEPSPPPDIEALLTTNWGVWVGSAALLFAGVFLVRYAVQQELLSPATRCGLAAILGIVLLSAAEFLHRHEGPPLVSPLHADQAPSALAAGGTAILFGAAYGAGPFYDLLPPLLTFAAMTAASLVALASALRYGPLTAATGIVGAFATPALVATHTPSLPGLFAYLFIVSAAAFLVVRRTAWTWLGWATTIAGAAWVCFAAILPVPDRWAAAAFLPAAAALNLLLLPGATLDHPVGRRLAWGPFATLGAAGLLLVSVDAGLAPRAAVFLLSPLAVWKGIVEPRLDRLPWIASAFGLLTLLVWSLPVLAQQDEAQAILLAASLLTTFNAAAGLWQERRAPNSLHWAALVAAVPVLALTIAYARISGFQTDIAWAAAACILSAALTAGAGAAARKNDRQRAGIHAAGAVAALALACAMLLHNDWLTLAIALFLPLLAWIEALTDLPPLRQVALAVAALIIVRLALNWYVLDYALGTLPLANWLLVVYAAPAALFAWASVLFRRRTDDALVATLEAGAVIFLALFIALEIRHWSGDGDLEHAPSFTEAALHLLTIAIQATFYVYLAERTGRTTLKLGWQVLGAIALFYGGAVIVLNPMVTGTAAGVLTLFAAYLAPALLAVLANRKIPIAKLRPYVGAYAVLAGFVWITLQIRQFFHPGQMGFRAAPIEAAELWGWSGSWLVYGIGLMGQAIRTGHRLLRLTALGVIGLVCAKVFVIDMAGLTGLWRVLSFLGLGLALIGLGVVYRRFVLPSRQTV